MRSPLSRVLVAVTLLISGVTIAAASRPALNLTTTQQADSVQVIARWNTPCDWRGCADSVRVQWTVGGVVVASRFTTRRIDTLKLAAPAWGDSVNVTAGLTSYRRRTTSTVATVSTVVRRLDDAPPAPDSLRLDTLSLRIQLEEIAQLDSFPVALRRIVPADTNAMDGVIAIGEGAQLCLLAKNKYTGRVIAIAEWETTDAELARIDAACAAVRVQYENERGG